MSSGINLGTLTARTPPGLRTLTISETASSKDSKCSKTSEQMTASYILSSKGSDLISPAPKTQEDLLVLVIEKS